MLQPDESIDAGEDSMVEMYVRDQAVDSQRSGASISSKCKAAPSLVPTRSFEKHLPSTLQEDLIRGVRLSTVLSGVGKHFGSIAASEEDYNLSVPVWEIDDFLSHDWRTPRMSKISALLLLYNSTAAAVGSCLAALIVAIVNLARDRASIGWVRIAGMTTWFVFFLFWQSFRQFFVLPRHAFLDKLCIHQTDEIKKQRGIKGLAGFLRVSDRMVILWTPEYFTRLWCSYELAAWYYIHGENGRKVCLWPVSAAEFRLTLTNALILDSIVTAVLTMHKDAVDEVQYYLAKAILLLVVFPFFQRMQTAVNHLRNLEESLLGYNTQGSAEARSAHFTD
eukprot:TRINITY_DN59451_c0_g1_i1.p1 TRINITY_DN59451_c0_g1~~TRINITY_DN59451_c0_g1_i1.p1  ORF type:complete len:335 (+),score=25.92 TRINITY_DN59451_c0_g1_i1:245-1249(+)